MSWGAPKVGSTSGSNEKCSFRAVCACVCVCQGREEVQPPGRHGVVCVLGCLEDCKRHLSPRKEKGKSGHCTLRETKQSKEDQLSVWLCPKQHPTPYSALLLIGCHLECKLCYTLLYRTSQFRQSGVQEYSRTTG